MDSEHARKMMDAFYEAKRIRDQLPPLPEGVRPSYIHTIDAVRQLSGQTAPAGQNGRAAQSDQKVGQNGRAAPVRVSDVADFEQLPRPVVTRTVKEMEKKGLLRKTADEKDRRVVHLALTPQAEALYQTYVQDYFGGLTQRLRGISNEETEEMIRTIHRVGEALRAT